MALITIPYVAQVDQWPKTGRQILAQFDDQSIVVYQAYRSTIGHFAATHGYFGGEFSFTRMSWIKPGFLWMMHRSEWGHKDGQEVILAVYLKRTAFDRMLAEAVPSTFAPSLYESEAIWKQAIKNSSVRFQWDPDYDPWNQKLARRAIQLGLRGDVLASYAHEWIISIEDISQFVQEQYQHVQAHNYDQLVTPREMLYPITDVKIAMK